MAANLLLTKAQFDLDDVVLTDVYECPEKRTNTVTLFLCNRGAAPVAIRIALAIAGAANDVKQYMYYDSPIAANNTLKLSFTLNEFDVIRVQPALSGVSCNVSVDQSRPLARL